MVLPEPLTVAELDVATAAWRAALVAGSPDGLPTDKSQLRELYDLLLRAASSSVRPDEVLTPDVVESVVTTSPHIIDALGPRPRTMARLLRAGRTDAAWALLNDVAAGIISEPPQTATATGSARVSGRRPLRALVEAPVVLARLPGLRDPRYDAPDSCYDITDKVKLRHQLDEVTSLDGVLRLGGWAALEIVTSGPDETVRLIVRGAGDDVVCDGQRLRRPDLVTGRDEGLVRRAWAGWAAAIDVDALGVGDWRVFLEIDHRGLVRRVPIGAATTELARAGARGHRLVGGYSVRWDTGARQWRLIVEGTGRVERRAAMAATGSRRSR